MMNRCFPQSLRENLDEAKYLTIIQYRSKPLEVKRAYQLYREQLGEKEPRTLEAMLSLGAVYLSQGRFDKAEALIASTLEISRRVRGEKTCERFGA